MSDTLNRPECLSCPPSAQLTPGGQYLYAPPSRRGCADRHEPVTLIGFTPYPATVIVLDRRNRRLYCDRGHLYSLKSIRKTSSPHVQR